jgi:hypothetical protein
VAVTVGPQWHLRVVDVQAAQPLLADDRHAVVHHLLDPLGCPYVESAREQMAGVEAESQPLVSAAQLDQLRQLLERAAEGVAGARRVLEQQPAGVRLRQRLTEHLADPLDRLVVGLADGRARVEHDAVGPDRVAHPQGVGQRVQRLLADLRLLRRAVDQVDRMDHDRLDRPVGHQLAELGDVVVLPARRPPHAGRLVEDLHRVGADLDGAGMGFDEAAGGGDVAPD